MSKNRRLRELLDQGITIAGAYDALSAKVTARAGFPAAYVTGFGVEASVVGSPDMGLMTLTELSSHISRITSAIDIPLISDADTGFGGANNIWRTVREMERAGASGIHIEDQTFPKRCPLIPGKRLVSPKEAAARIKVAAEAKTDPDFLLIARSDADVISVSELIDRENLYLDSGADAVLPILLEIDGESASKVGPEKVLSTYERLVREINGPIIALDPPPGMTAQQLLDVGVRCVILPTALLELAYQTLMSAATQIRADDAAEPYFERQGLPRSLPAIADLLGVSETLRRDEEFEANAGLVRQ